MKKAFPVILISAAAGLGCSSAALAAGYQGTQTILYSFTGGADGSAPIGPLAPDSYGDLFGITHSAGASCVAPGSGCGTVFEIDASGQFHLLHQFAGGAGGTGPAVGPTLIGGKLYGSALGGTLQTQFGDLAGVVYSINTDGSAYTVLHDFNGNDGFYPSTPVLPAPGGGLYGATEYGGPSFKSKTGYSSTYGLIYLLQPNGILEQIHVFRNKSDGRNPISLVEDGQGDLFGTDFVSPAGSASDSRTVQPIVFRIDRTTRAFQVLYTLPPNTVAALSRVDANGVLYGAYTGTPTESTGAMFTLTPTSSGTYQYAAIGTIDPHTGGVNPLAAGPALGPNGMLVAASLETLDYEIGQNHYSFNLSPPGYPAYLTGPVNVAADGSVYGAIQTGGTYLQGAIYKFTITRTTN